MKSYEPPTEGSSGADAFLTVMGKESDGLHRLYGRGVTTKMLKKMNGTEMSYIVSKEVFESLTNATEVEKSYQRGKEEVEQLQKEFEANHELKRVELEEMRKNIENQWDKIVDDAVKMVLARLPPEIAKEYL